MSKSPFILSKSIFGIILGIFFQLNVISNAFAEADFTLNNDQLQRLLGPTLTSARVQISSTTGSIAIRLPNGSYISRAVSVPPFEAGPMTCTLQPIQNVGTPTLSYQNGLFRFTMMLRPVSGITLIRTDGIWPNVTASSIQVDISFRLKLENGGIKSDGIVTSVTGDFDLTGLARPFSPIARPEIQRQMASRIESQIRPQLDIALGIILPTYIAQATGYGATLIFSGAIQHFNDYILFPITGRNQVAPRPNIFITGIDPNAVNIEAIRNAPVWTGTKVSDKAEPSLFSPEQIKMNPGTPIESSIQNNNWKFNISKIEYLDKTGLNIMITVRIVNESKVLRSLSDAGFITNPTILDANGNPAPNVDQKNATTQFFGVQINPGETVTLPLYFFYNKDINPKKIAPDVLNLINKNVINSIALRLK